ncbi:MarR family transcriptional regulator, partial [Turicibacter sanguinis]|nr:MarR family transcriptional regulator [Turicibacter sanguinis]
DSFKGFTEEEKAKTVEYLNRICQNLKGRESQHDE